MVAIIFLIISAFAALIVAALLRIHKPVARTSLVVLLIFLISYGTFVTTKHFYHVQFYSGYVFWNLRYSAYLKSKLEQGDIESASNAVFYFDTRLRTNSDSAKNMITTVGSILREEIERNQRNEDVKP